ncbi:hypothetical protein OESDEN_16517 [Oesophagostomum dentatum]|uniref:Uncharacterized protein n=1 Tax=Oesophagostomum dentatum TaxID=61180 RepID=A0A0B1SKP7_OESDE|nr:hypothetical protein OESDEN_16517 [Oesophagostomum dentatum]
MKRSSNHWDSSLRRETLRISFCRVHRDAGRLLLSGQWQESRWENMSKMLFWN